MLETENPQQLRNGKVQQRLEPSPQKTASAVERERPANTSTRSGRREAKPTRRLRGQATTTGDQQQQEKEPYVWLEMRVRMPSIAHSCEHSDFVVKAIACISWFQKSKDLINKNELYTLNQNRPEVSDLCVFVSGPSMSARDCRRQRPSPDPQAECVHDRDFVD